ncbi:MAG: polymer-forming cytoskeletal protein [Candidatus Kerfeldbacteria bacterium]|nr:polymer-forming cytoskeletal protein [Candidatus Kerfeldbacteria bacterium]
MFAKDSSEHGRDVETIIGSTVKVDGNFVGGGDVVVEGHVAGSLKTSKSLRVGPGAVVKAEVEAANITVAGEIRGHIKCQGKIELASTAKIFGNVDTKSIVVAHGAILHGKITMANQEPAPPTKG